jgi:hypothetical protein
MHSGNLSNFAPMDQVTLCWWWKPSPSEPSRYVRVQNNVSYDY